MHHAKNTRTSLTHAGLLIRAFFLSLLLMGSLLASASSLVGSQVFAQRVPTISQQSITKLKPLAVLSTKKSLRSEKQITSSINKGPSTSLNSLGVPPYMSMTSDIKVATPYEVDRTFIFDLNITNTSLTTSIDSTSGVQVKDPILGLTNIGITGGSAWDIISNTSPIQANYIGPTVAPGGVLPPLEITGIFTNDAIPVWNNTAAATDTLYPNTPAYSGLSELVYPSTQTPTPTAIPTPTDTPIPTPTDTPIPTPTDTPIPTPTDTPIPTPTDTPIATPTDTPIPTPTDTPIATPTDTPIATPTDTPIATPTDTPVATPTDTPIATPTDTPIATPTVQPQLSITNSTTGGSTYYVGQTINFSLIITNLPSSLANLPSNLVQSQPIIVHDAFSVGLDNIVATGSGWTINLSSMTSPAEVTATYDGPYPLAPGAILPIISISGNLTAAASSLTSSATVNAADDPNPPSNPSINTITILDGTATPIATMIPDLSVVKINLGGDHFKVGDRVTYVIIVSNGSENAPVGSPITVSDVIPLGLSNIEVKAPDWHISVSDHTSPAVITANYNGSFPVAPGQILSPITISGTLNENAVPSLTGTATVATLGDINEGNNTATDTIFVNDNSHQDNTNKGSHQDNTNKGSHQDNTNKGSHQDNTNKGSHQDNNNSNRNSSSPGLPATGGAAEDWSDL